MVDIEPEVFTRVATALRQQFTGITVGSDYPTSSALFPFCSVSETSNTVDKSTQTGNSVENHSILLYELNFYSNKVSGRKTEAKAIAAVADMVMAGMGFTRTFKQPTPNLADATVFRITARYSAELDVKTKTIYGR